MIMKIQTRQVNCECFQIWSELYYLNLGNSSRQFAKVLEFLWCNPTKVWSRNIVWEEEEHFTSVNRQGALETTDTVAFYEDLP